MPPPVEHRVVVERVVVVEYPRERRTALVLPVLAMLWSLAVIAMIVFF